MIVLQFLHFTDKPLKRTQHGNNQEKGSSVLKQPTTVKNKFYVQICFVILIIAILINFVLLYLR